MSHPEDQTPPGTASACPAGADRPITFADPAVQQCPFDAYAKLLDEAPVYLDPETGNYVVTRYQDVRDVSLNPRQLSNKTGLIGNRSTETAKEAEALFIESGAWPAVDTLVSNDPPSHRLYRSLVDRAFAPVRIAALEGRITEIADQLIDSIQDRKEVEFLADFAIPLPMTVIAEELGVDAADMDRFKYWSDQAVTASSPILDREQEFMTARAIIEMQHYLAVRIAHYRDDPDDSKLLSRLVHAEIDGRRLDMRELQDILKQLLVAGNETTTMALAAGMKTLIDEPALVARLRAEPDKMRTFVEEVLRLKAPVQALFRRAVEPVEIGGVSIPEGGIVELRYGAANRDPRVFGDPDRVDLDRANYNSHLTFGAGIHMCIGNQLARAELRIAFSRLIERLGGFRLSRGEDTCLYTDIYISYGITRLWLAFDRL